MGIGQTVPKQALRLTGEWCEIRQDLYFMRYLDKLNSIEAYETNFITFNGNRPRLWEKSKFDTIFDSFLNSYVDTYYNSREEYIRILGIFDTNAKETLKSLGFKQVQKTDKEQFILDDDFKNNCIKNKKSIVKLFSEVLGIRMKLGFSSVSQSFEYRLDFPN